LLFVYRGLCVNGWVTPRALQLARSHLIYSIKISSSCAACYTSRSAAGRPAEEVDVVQPTSAKAANLRPAPVLLHHPIQPSLETPGSPCDIPTQEDFGQTQPVTGKAKGASAQTGLGDEKRPFPAALPRGS